jgi:hypothetical protein
MAFDMNLHLGDFGRTVQRTEGRARFLSAVGISDGTGREQGESRLVVLCGSGAHEALQQ